MRILRQISLIFLICLVCEGIASILPFPFPGSVLSMVVLFLMFALKILKPEDIAETSGLLLGNMMLVFVPSFVSIMNYFDVLKHIVVQFIVIIVVSTMVTFLVGGAVVSLVCRLQNRIRSRKEEA
jgi:holin-like protein